MKIALVYPTFYGIGGIARYLESFFTNLPKNCSEIVLITENEMYIEKNIPGVEIIHVPLTPSRLNLIVWGLKVRKILISMYRNKEISHVNFHFPPMIPGLFLPKEVPLILSVHTTYLGMPGKNSNEVFYKGNWNRFSIVIKILMERVLFLKSNRIIALNATGKEEIRRYGCKKPVSIIPNGVDIDYFSSNKNIKKDIDVLFCGRLEQEKGSRSIINVCEKLISIKHDVKICIVGYGNDESHIKEELTKYGNNVQLTGKIPFSEVRSFYNRSRVYVSTSYYEGLPGTCLESMSMGLPVVVWDLPFYSGLVNNGSNGFLVPVNDFEKMVQVISDLLDDDVLASTLSSKARKHIESFYSWKELAIEMLDNLEGSAKVQ